MRRLRVGVTGTGSLIGQAIIKSLTASGLCQKGDMVGFDYFHNTIGSYWVGATVILPDILKGETENAWLNVLMDALRSEKIDILLIGVDFELKLFAKYKDLIESKTGCKVPVSAPQVIEIADDKYQTYTFLKENDLAYPRTWLLDKIDDKDIEYPCIVKPRRGARSVDVFLVKDERELRSRTPFIKDPIAQEMIGGRDSEYTCGVIRLDGRTHDMIALKRYLKDGNTETAIFTGDHPAGIDAYVRGAADLLKPFGACNFQLRLSKDGTPTIFEINARHSGTTYVRTLFGFNEVEYIVRHIFNIGSPRFNLRYGTVKRYYDEMFIQEA